MNVFAYLNYFFDLPNFRISFFGLPNLLLHFNYLLGIKVPKLLESYGSKILRAALRVFGWSRRSLYVEREERCYPLQAMGSWPSREGNHVLDSVVVKILHLEA